MLQLCKLLSTDLESLGQVSTDVTQAAAVGPLRTLYPTWKAMHLLHPPCLTWRVYWTRPGIPGSPITQVCSLITSLSVPNSLTCRCPCLLCQVGQEDCRPGYAEPAVVVGEQHVMRLQECGRLIPSV